MTDKQIIIDGVDVSGCEFYNNVIGEDAYCNIDEEHLCTCISYDNCYYKQLQAKEQECKKLKEYFETAKEASNCNLKALGEMTEWADKLDEENDQLKAENEELKNFHINLVGVKECEIKELLKLKATLTEIKEIAEAWQHTDGAFELVEEILQKISEVENG